MMFIDIVLAKYWVPRGTKLHQHHLPSILIGVAVFALLSVSIPNDALSHQTKLVIAVTLILVQFIFGYLARLRFGDDATKGSSFYTGDI